MTTEPDETRNFIDGQFVEPVGGRYLDNIEPATGRAYSRVADSDGGDVKLAVAAAEKAFADWSRILLRIAELIERDLEKFARAESIDTGKPLSTRQMSISPPRDCMADLTKSCSPTDYATVDKKNVMLDTSFKRRN